MKPMMITRTIFLDDHEEDIDFPAKHTICNKCNGNGKHSNPNIDKNGITGEEWENDWSEEERLSYLSNVYDIICSECHGKRVTLVIDQDKILDNLLKKYYKLLCDQDEQRDKRNYEEQLTIRGESGYK